MHYGKSIHRTTFLDFFQPQNITFNSQAVGIPFHIRPGMMPTEAPGIILLRRVRRSGRQ